MTSVAEVCVLFLLKLKWPENKSFYDKVGASFWWMLLFIRVEFTFLVLSCCFFRMFVDVDPVSVHKHAEKAHGQYEATLTLNKLSQ